MGLIQSSNGGKTPTGRNVSDYMGRPPSATGTGPKNLAKTEAESTSQVRAGRPKASAAQTPRVRPNLASAGAGRIPGGAASGIPKATTPMASPARTVINRPKTKQAGKSRRLPKPRADFPSKI